MHLAITGAPQLHIQRVDRQKSLAFMAYLRAGGERADVDLMIAQSTRWWRGWSCLKSEAYDEDRAALNSVCVLLTT